MSEQVRYIRCNGADVLINDWTGNPTLCADWSSEQCEGCGEDIVGTCIVRSSTTVECVECKATYDIRHTTQW